MMNHQMITEESAPPQTHLTTEEDNDEDCCDMDDDEEDDEEHLTPYICNNQDSEILHRESKAALIINLYPPERGYTICCSVRDLEGDDPNEIEVFKESQLIPYSDRYILDCVDTEVIPLRLMRKLEMVDGANLMKYFGCVVCEVRDYRRFTTNTSKRNAPVVKKVLLKPTNDVLLSEMDTVIEKSMEDWKLCKTLMTELLEPNNDEDTMEEEEVGDGDDDAAPETPDPQDTVNSAESAGNETEPEDEPIPPKRRKVDSDNGSDEGHSQSTDQNDNIGSINRRADNLTFQELLEVEKQIMLKTHTGLCLDPSKSVGLIANARQFERFKWNTPAIKKVLKSFQTKSKGVQISDADAQKMNTFVNFLKSKKKVSDNKSLMEKLDEFRLPSMNCNVYSELKAPTNLEELSRIGQPTDTALLRQVYSENLIRKVDEYILETERRKRPHTTKLTIYQRNGTESYFGELEQESFAEPNNCHDIMLSNTAVRGPSGEPAPSTKCQFELGSMKNVNLYVRQFTDIFTEDGRRPCKITYQKVGHGPQSMIINDYKSLSTTPTPNSSVSGLASNSKVTTIAGGSATVTVSVGKNGNNNSILGTPVNLGKSPVSSCSGPRVSVIPNLSKPLTVQSAVASSTATAIGTSATVVAVSNTLVPPPAITATTATQPPVQIVHPQPRSVQQTQISRVQTAQYTTARTTAIVQQPHAVNQGNPANVNLNLNATARVVQPQPILTRPPIINVNVNPQTNSSGTSINYAIPKIQTAAQLLQHQQLKAASQTVVSGGTGVRPRQPTPTLATLLLSGVQTNSGTKPITVAIQPQPQNPNVSQIQLGTSLDQQKQNSFQQQLSQLVTQHQSQSTSQQPIMIMVSPPTNGNLAATTSGAGTQQHANGSVSLNLNAISLESILNSQQQNFATTGSLVTTNNSLNNTAGLNRLNILRLSNNTNTVTLNTQQLLRQNAVLNVNRTNSTAQLVNTGIIISSPANARNPNQCGQIVSTSTVGNNRMATIAPALGQIKQEPKSNDGTPSDLGEIGVSDLHSLLNTAPGVSNNAGFRGHGTTTATIDGLNLDLNLNLNLNLSGTASQPSISASTLTANANRTDTGHQLIYNTGNTSNSNELNHGHGHGVDNLFNVLSEVIGPELGQKLDGSVAQTSGSSPGITVVNSSMSSPTKATTPNNNNTVITLNDLLASPPIIVSSSAVPPTNGISPIQSPQSPSITSILSPVSQNVGVPTSHNYNSTPRLSALLAGTPSADSSSILSPTSIFDPASGRGVNVSGPVNTSSYGNLLDRLVASSSQPQVTQQRTGGSRLNPIATATPMLAASLGQGNITQNARPGLTRPTTYRQIAPAPPPNPQPQQQQQLINLLGFVPQSNNVSGSVQSQPTQTTIRVNASNSAGGTGGNLAGR